MALIYKDVLVGMKRIWIWILSITQSSDGTEISTVMFRAGEELFWGQDDTWNQQISQWSRFSSQMRRHKAHIDDLDCKTWKQPRCAGRSVSSKKYSQQACILWRIRTFIPMMAPPAMSRQQQGPCSMVGWFLLIIPTQCGDIIISRLCEGLWKWFFFTVFTHAAFDMSLALCILLLFSCFIYNSNN